MLKEDFCPFAADRFVEVGNEHFTHARIAQPILYGN